MSEKTTILIADDEAEILSMYKQKLTHAGFAVLTASNGEEACVAIKESKPDLVLMDIKMPIMDGMTAQQKLHSDPETQYIRVVFLTAFSNHAADQLRDVNFTKQSGALGFIQKGEDLNTLVSKVREYLTVPVE
ncbi:MAG: response regulator [bacterium]